MALGAEKAVKSEVREEIIQGPYASTHIHPVNER